MADAVEFLLLGVVLGLVQGISPGPLVALVISETLKFGRREGFKVAVSPLITDSTVVLLSLVVLSNLAQYSVVIGVISIFGACYLVYLGVENLRVKAAALEANVIEKEAFRRAVITNFLNPHVYVFWLAVGTPILLRGLDIHVSASIFFLIGFYVFIIGTKASIAYVVDRSKVFIGSKYYSMIVRILGVILIVFALLLISEALKLMNS